jgi:hypothetical protein
VQDNDYFALKVPALDVNGVTNQETTAYLYSLTVPLGIRVQANASISLYDGTTTTTTYMLITDPSQTDSTPSATLFNIYVGSIASGAPAFGYFTAIVMTDTSGRIRSRVSAKIADLYEWILTQGWRDITL